jgi:hypothetical protein
MRLASEITRSPVFPPSVRMTRFFSNLLAYIMHETPSRDRGDGLATGQPQGLGPEAYFFSTSQGELVLSLPKELPRTAGRTAISAVAVGGSCIMRARRRRPRISEFKALTRGCSLACASTHCGGTPS